MAFQRAGDFLLLAAKKYKLSDQVLASIMCEKVRNILRKKYADFADMWHLQKFEHGVLSIATENSAAGSELFLRTHELLEDFAEHDFPEKINEIRIVRKKQTVNYPSN